MKIMLTSDLERTLTEQARKLGITPSDACGNRQNDGIDGAIPRYADGLGRCVSGSGG